MTKLFGYLGAASVLALCSLAACTVSSTSDVSGVGDGGKSDATTSDAATDAPVTKTDGGGDGGSCKVTGGQAACDTCLTNKCCAVTVGCEDDADCSQLISCIDSCAKADSGPGDAGGAEQACINTCGDAHPASVKKFNDSVSCLQSNCSAQCPG